MIGTRPGRSRRRQSDETCARRRVVYLWVGFGFGFGLGLGFGSGLGLGLGFGSDFGSGLGSGWVEWYTKGLRDEDGRQQAGGLHREDLGGLRPLQPLG